MREPVVVGAFPEPFLHGYLGQGEAGRGSLRARPRGGRPRARPAPACELGRAAFGRARFGRECLLHSKWQRPIHGFVARSGLERGLARPVHLRRRRSRSRPPPGSLPLPVQRPVSPVPAAALLASLAAVSLIADRGWVVALIAGGLFLVCLAAPRSRRWLYISGTLISALSVFVLSPLVSHVGTHVIWEGPQIPVIGYLDVTSEELAAAGIQALRLAAVGLAFAGVCAAPRPRPAAPVGRLRASVGPRRRPGHAARPDARARCGRPRRGSARTRRAGRGHPRPGEAAVAAWSRARSSGR